jgi:transcriptional regulator with XRE-family HTH domain
MAARSDRIWLAFGTQIKDARLQKSWSIRELASRAGVSVGMAYRVEAGEPASTETAWRLASALGRRAELVLVDPRRRDSRPNLSEDAVHSAMGEFEAEHLRALGFKVGIDEPYQHYQFAGRADLVAWDVDARALLHIENRTRFPDFQEMAGSFNQKRAYFGDAFAERVGVRAWRSQTHVIAALWSSEVQHALRLRTSSFRALCPDQANAVEAYWDGAPPTSGSSASLIVLDPGAIGKRREWIDLDSALTARPRYRGYSDAAASLARKGVTAAASSSG